MDFYTDCFKRGDKIYLKGLHAGERYTEVIDYKPYLFTPTRNKSSYQTIDGQSVEKIEFDSIKQAEGYAQSSREFYGMSRWAHVFLNDQYPTEIQFDKKLINVGNIDIEVDSSDGFPHVAQAAREITAITIEFKDRYYVFTTVQYLPHRPDVVYKKCVDEKELLKTFLRFWKACDFDVVTGWYIEFFDIPYIVNRLKNLFGEKEVKKLSPWGFVWDREVDGKQVVKIQGIAVLDYQRLYKEFTLTEQENYRLDHIGYIELGERKLDYSEFDSLHELFMKDPQKFIEYNIRDVELVKKLDNRLQLLNLAFFIAYTAKINYEECFTTVLLWDVIIHNFMLARGLVVNKLVVSQKENNYQGAFVKEPLIGRHKWIVSFDVKSLYPSLMVQYNMSAETYAGTIDGFPSIETLLKSGYPQIEELDTYAIAANGTMWRKDVKGIFPQLIEGISGQRDTWKKRMFEIDKRVVEAEQNNDPNLGEIEGQAMMCNVMQQALKIILNSLYGALGNPSFRWFRVAFAEGITLTGQYTIQYVGNGLDRYVTEVTGQHGPFCIAQDTDSAYIKLDALVDKYCKDMPSEKIVDFLDNVSKKRLEPLIDRMFQTLVDQSNAYSKYLRMKREVIAETGIWRRKKNYALSVWDSEGTRYPAPVIKIKGLEAVKSSTPEICRKRIKEALRIMLQSDEEHLFKMVDEFKTEFYSLSFDEVASPTSCSDIDTYRDKTRVYKKATPIHVRAALLYNKTIQDAGLDKKYDAIKSGDKIKYCYMKLPNPIRENVLASLTVLPKQLGLDQYVDYEKQFYVTFLKPVESICSVIGWTTEEVSTLLDLF